MKFSVFLDCIDRIENQDLVDSEQLIQKITKHRIQVQTNPKNPPRKAAVLALFYPKNEQTYLALMLRESYNGVHSNQISFPGGKMEMQDKDLYQTALREAQEELNIDPISTEFIKEINKVFIPPSNFEVSPFLAYTKNRPNFQKNHEVASLIEFPIFELLKEDSIEEGYKNFADGSRIKTQYFKHENHQIWGATAIMLAEIRYYLSNSI